MSQSTLDRDLQSGTSNKTYETVVIDDQIVDLKANQTVEFAVDDETTICVVTRTGKRGDPRIFERLPLHGDLQQYVVVPARVVLTNGKPYHGDRYTAVGYCERLRKLIFLHDAIDKWSTREIVSWAVYRSDGPSKQHDLGIKEIRVVPLESKESSVSS
ncbi:MAG: hypothetical protein H6797_00575 [Candidatus Nomurabacteria bacterium]|nr:MAG: hypothetical protein H6797_00575 [Candidatus Nomurabacteria bacterium]